MSTRNSMLRHVVCLVLLILATAALGWGLRPTLKVSQHRINMLDQGVPHSFAEWVTTPSPLAQADLTVAGNAGQRTNANPYDEVVTRTYVNTQGQHVMLAIAYAAEQRQEVKIHRPDLCYPAQGFQQTSWAQEPLSGIRGAHGPITAVKLVVQRRDRTEAVLYWLRTGSNYGQRMWDGRMEILKEGLQGRIPDGVLVRASRIIRLPDEAPQAFSDLERFLTQLTAASSPAALALLTP